MEAESLSKKLCITECDVFAAESALTRRTINIDESTPDYDDAEKFIICHYGSSTKITEDDAQMLAIESVMDQLDDTQRLIIKKRFLGDKKVTLKSLSEKIGISQAGVRHIELTAIDFLKEAANQALLKMSY
jgi:RNA polymerase sigma factor (sigma-70 family)